jgi:hypothetical protein
MFRTVNSVFNRRVRYALLYSTDDSVHALEGFLRIADKTARFAIVITIASSSLRTSAFLFPTKALNSQQK